MQKKGKAQRQSQKGTLQLRKMKMDTGGWAGKSERAGGAAFPFWAAPPVE